MSISSYTTVTMLDSRPAEITLSVPKSTDITNRIITFKDLYGSASNSTIILVTQSGDSFEDGTFSTIMSNAYQTVNLYAGLPGKWLNVGATGGGGDSAGLTTVSNHLNAISTNVITISTNLNTVSNTVAAGRFPGISTNTISTGTLNAGYVITRLPQNTSGTSVSPLSVGNGDGYNFFNPQIEFQYKTGGYKHFIGSRHTNNVANDNRNAIDFYLYSATTGGSNASTTPGTCNVNALTVTASGIGILNYLPTVALDVAGGGRFTAVSTNTISTNTISTNTMSANQYHGDGSLLTGITASFLSTATSDLNMNGNYLKDLTGNVDISGASINLHTSSIQQYLNYIPVAQPIIQFGSWSADAANTDTTGGPYTIPITSYDNTNYCIYITGKYTTVSVAYSAVPVDASNFNVYFVNGDPYGSNIFYWQTMGYYGASAGPVQGSGGGGGGGHT